MRAWRLHRPAPILTAPLRLEEVPDPVPGPGEVVVKVRACAICRTDLHVVEGELPPRLSPVTPGHQVVGEVLAVGPEVVDLAPGTRVGVAWLHGTDGVCRFCRSGRENLCEQAAFTGWTADGGFAERIRARAAFVYPLSADLEDRAAAPLLCAGIIGFRALQLAGLDGRWAGARLGIYGFGAAGHVAIQIARARGAEVYVATRDRSRHQALATELGAAWVGDAAATPPQPLDAAIVFAPAGELVPVALAAVDAGGAVVLGGIHMSDIPPLPYQRLYRERVLRTVANNTRADGRAFLAEAARARVRTHTRLFPFTAANEALAALKTDAIRGAGVLVMD
jgi:propanol-preferring alcohol dehydrogenase